MIGIASSHTYSCVIHLSLSLFRMLPVCRMCPARLTDRATVANSSAIDLRWEAQLDGCPPQTRSSARFRFRRRSASPRVTSPRCTENSNCLRLTRQRGLS